MLAVVMSDFILATGINVGDFMLAMTVLRLSQSLYGGIFFAVSIYRSMLMEGAVIK